jgi:diaminohydroxyphosphoribosylaminopyrimidine deaminase/5-amino-6-(5-phosphoribosylamino)uracil reductase
MQRALELAARGRATTHPNPRVGCVIVKDGAVAGEGFHERAGGPHAEVVALQAAGARAKGADVFVTLEPCCHHGRTPPCTDALIAAGVKRVHAALRDPNPQVAGRGFEALQRAGIECAFGPLEAEARQLNRGFVSRMTRKRPWLTLKLAMSLDGRTAMASGESRWITSAEARADAHRLRAEAGAVLTSVNTVLADDPELTVRSTSQRSALSAQPSFVRQPDRIVIDTQLRSPAAAKVWSTGARRVALAVRPAADRVDALRKAGVEVALVGTTPDGRVDLGSALAQLATLEVNEVLAECGPTLSGALLAAGLVDELVIYAAPVLLGHDARALATLPGLASLSQAIHFQFSDVTRIGDDVRLTLLPQPPAPSPQP